MEEIFSLYIKENGFVSNHLDTYNHWITEKTEQLFYNERINFKGGNAIIFRNFRILKPRYIRDGKTLYLTPKLAREQGKMYSAEWKIDIVLSDPKGNEIKSIKDVTIAEIPVMVKSKACILHGLSDRELALLGEDPNDPGGYFIIQGRNEDIGYEKVVILQEKLAINKFLLLNLDREDTPGPEVLFTTEDKKGSSVIIRLLQNPKLKNLIVFQIPLIKKYIAKEKKGKTTDYFNIFVIFRLLGVKTVEEVRTLLSYFLAKEDLDKCFFKLITNIIDNHTIIDEKQYLKEKIASNYDLNKVLEEMIEDAIFPNVNNLPLNYGETAEQYQERKRWNKIYLLTLMLVKFLEHLIGKRELEDRNSWSNKRLEGAGRLMETLFKLAWRKTRKTIVESLENMKGEVDLKIVETKIKRSKITTTFNDSFATAKWGLRGVKGIQHTKANVTQILFRDSSIATISHLATIDVEMMKNNRFHEIRLVQNSQWGLICPIFCPENDRAGIVKNLTFASKLSLDRDDSLIIRYLYGDDVLKPMISFTERKEDSYIVILNGKFLGWSLRNNIYEELISLRRSMKIYFDTSIIKEGKWIFIDNSPSRPIYPALILDEDQVPIYQKINAKPSSISELLSNGSLEFISAWEQETIKIASTLSNVKERLDLISDAKRNLEQLEIELKKEKDKELELGKDKEKEKNKKSELEEQLEIELKKEKEKVSELEEQLEIELKKGKEKVSELEEQLEIELKKGKEKVSELEEQLEIELKKEKEKVSELEEQLEIELKKEKEKVSELEEQLISERARYNDALRRKPFTHVLLDPTIILSAVGANIPWPNHNQAPRNSYQVSMSKQALGTYHAYHQTRYDKKTKILAFTTRPVVETKISHYLGLDMKPSGENIIVAFMAMPFTEEDSFIVKKEFLDNGGFRIFKHFVYNIVVKNNDKITETLCHPDKTKNENVKVSLHHDLVKYRFIQDNGLPIIGSYITPGDCIIGKIKTIRETGIIEDSSVFMKNDDYGIIERIRVNNIGTETRIKIKFRTMRIPIAGDKFAPRNAQKGTIGLVMPEADLPFSEEGLTPDFIVNPHSIPSRMTMEYLMEIIASKHAAYRFTFIDGTAFKPFEINLYRETLRAYGKNEFSYEKVRSGITGKYLLGKNSSLYMGPVFFQALKHHVLDKIQARGYGSTVMKDTRQPQKGRANAGGLRFGEMERDAVIAYGASSFLRERLKTVSDEYYAPFCRNCGIFAIFNFREKNFLPCPLCEKSDFGFTSIPFVYKLLMNYLAIMGIFLRPGFISSSEITNEEVIEDVNEQLKEFETLPSYFEPEEEINVYESMI
ncbi:MAG: hypothetical protein ABIM64_04765 [candidate division WOR-3 bacterium]